MKTTSQPVTVERQHITREFADTFAGKQPAPYLRIQDPVQKALAEAAATAHGREAGTAYFDSMIHFWREVSLAGMPFGGKYMDEVYALLFEASFEAAKANSPWAIKSLEEKLEETPTSEALEDLARQVRAEEIAHCHLGFAFNRIYAMRRERDNRWNDETHVALSGELWFWVALMCAVEPQSDPAIAQFVCKLHKGSAQSWQDNRLNTRLIRSAAVRAGSTPRVELMEHSLMRIARLKYGAESLEQKTVLRFLNAQCIKEGVESEEDSFSDPLRLAQWVRDARNWAEDLACNEPETISGLLREIGEKGLANNHRFYERNLADCGVDADAVDVSVALMKWARRDRGFEVSWYRAQLWEFLVHVVDAALWLGWLYPEKSARRNLGRNS